MTKVVSEDRHVAVLPFPFSSHAGSLLSIVTRLAAAAAPNVTFSFYSTPKSIETLFAPAKRVPGNIKPYVVSDGVPDRYVFSGKPQEEINFYIAAVEESFKGVLKAAEAETGQRIGCVMSDAFLWFAGDLAKEMGVPWVSFWCAGANSCAAHFYTDLIMDTVGMHDTVGRENGVLNFVPGFPELRLGNLPPGILISNSEPPFVTMLHKMGRALHKATAVILNSFEEIDPEINQDLKSKLKMLLNVGPSNLLSSSSLPPSSYSDEYGCIPWLDNFKAVSVAYIGFGTMLTPSPPEIVALAEALEASGTPFLWSLKDNMKDFLPQGFMERTSRLGKIVPWAPQQQILAHSSIGVSVTHCGWNSILESIVAGVPLIGRPFFADNLLNGWMMENVWKIGLRLEGGIFTKNGTMSALELVLNHEKGKEMRKQIGKYKELAWKAVGPQGSSTQNFNTLLEVVTGYNL
ncbi:hypothetical protein Vadar_026682 [Vaccinium darrowii]|uniref:Uncharacterized protein n=1 Tax=Vaccinium darrowii TaxID=229202 RepID=A0ACB7ZML0_9ERIC|nr:hypothetical protein Vadar_026682 [Vaccinium darrowii]